MRRRLASATAAAVGAWCVLAASSPLGATAGTAGTADTARTLLRQLSTDPYTNRSSQHMTEVEPDTFSHGAVEVAAFQAGRFFDSGASNIGWATTKDNGSTWSHGFLPGTTTYAHGPWRRVSDPAVGFDPKRNVWLIAALARGGAPMPSALLVSRSTDGGTAWSKPVIVTSTAVDKDWVTCDRTPASPYYGNCYAEWDDNANHDLVYMSTSTDGGLSWSTPATTADRFRGIGGQPVVQPDGTVVVPIDNHDLTTLEAFRSNDGGTTWTAPVVIAAVKNHQPGGSLRNESLPSAVVDRGGNVYVVWESCELESGCASDDILLSTSSTGTSWTSPVMVPIDALDSGVDHLLPGLGVDQSTAGGTAHLGIDFYAQSSTCTTACSLSVGFISSSDGGATWTAAATLARPMDPTWLADTGQGRMVGDYNSTSFLGGKAYPVFAVATAPSGGTFNESMDGPIAGLALEPGTRPAIAGQVFNR
jgi:BNR repeat-like domain